MLMRDFNKVSEVFTYYSAGGWRYLSFLDLLQRHLHRKATQLFQYCAEGLSQQTFNRSPVVSLDSMKSVMLVFCKMARVSGPEAKCRDIGTRILDRVEEFEAQDSNIQELILQIIDSAIMDLAGLLGVRNIISDWVRDYEKIRRLHGPVTMLQDTDEIQKVGSTIVTGILFYACFHDGLSKAMNVLQDKLERKTTKSRLKRLSRRIEYELDDRLDDDVEGKPWDHSGMVVEGLLFARRLGFDDQNMFY